MPKPWLTGSVTDPNGDPTLGIDVLLSHGRRAGSGRDHGCGRRLQRLRTQQRLLPREDVERVGLRRRAGPRDRRRPRRRRDGGCTHFGQRRPDDPGKLLNAPQYRHRSGGRRAWPRDPSSGLTPVSVLFTTVIASGRSEFHMIQDGLPPPPSSYAFGLLSLFFDVTTTAVFAGAVDDMLRLQRSDLPAGRFAAGAPSRGWRSGWIAPPQSTWNIISFVGHDDDPVALCDCRAPRQHPTGRPSGRVGRTVGRQDSRAATVTWTTDDPESGIQQRTGMRQRDALSRLRGNDADVRRCERRGARHLGVGDDLGSHATPPTVTCGATPSVLWPHPNGKLTPDERRRFGCRRRLGTGRFRAAIGDRQRTAGGRGHGGLRGRHGLDHGDGARHASRRGQRADLHADVRGPRSCRPRVDLRGHGDGAARPTLNPSTGGSRLTCPEARPPCDTTWAGAPVYDRRPPL